MKQVLIGFTFLIGLNVCSQNEKPEIVYSIAKELKEIPWYETQLKLWKAELEKNNQNGEAWINYYMASRALRNVSEHESADKKKYIELCSKIVTDVQTAMPKSFESYFLAYSETGIAGSDENLKKAEILRPNDPGILDELMIRYNVDRNQGKFEEYAREMFKINEMPVGMLNWGYNLLAELDENAIVFTCGDNDTYSLWISQAVKNFRKDVTVVNTYLMHLDDYRNKLFVELGYPPLNLKAYQTDEEYQKNSKLIYEHFFNGKRPVYVSTTAISLFEENYGSKLYLTGLAYKYSETSFDAESIIRRNYEKRYLLDYLNVVFAYNIGDLKGEEFNGMYLPSMIKLYKQYTESEETTKRLELETLMLKIAAQNGQQHEIKALIH